MAIEYIKKAAKTAATGEDDTREVVIKILREIEEGGRAAWKDALALAIIACRGISR